MCDRVSVIGGAKSEREVHKIEIYCLIEGV